MQQSRGTIEWMVGNFFGAGELVPASGPAAAATLAHRVLAQRSHVVLHLRVAHPEHSLLSSTFAMPRRRREAEPHTIAEPLDTDAAANASSPPPPPRKRARRFKSPAAPVDAYVHKSYKPRVKHCNHSDSSVGENFHSVPYPLGLMPYSSWHLLHHRRDESSHEHTFTCPACRKQRTFPSAHRQKLFLIAERLTWEEGMVPMAERELNQELTWEVNFKIGIEEPVMQDLEHVPGGKRSMLNKWHPFQNEADCAVAMKLIARADCLTETSYALWSKMMDSLYAHEHEPSASLSSLSQSSAGQSQGYFGSTAGSAHELVLPWSSSPFASPMSQGPISHVDSHQLLSMASASTPSTHQTTPADVDRTTSEPPARPVQRSLPELYALLDAIERTSYVGAQYLEAYAEQLRDDLCEDCWWTHNISIDDALPS